MIDVKGTSGVIATKLGRGPDDADQAEEVRGKRNGETVELAKDALTLAQEMQEELGLMLEEELEDELGREERKIEAAEDALEIVLAGEIEGDPAQLPDLLARRDDIEQIGQEMQASGMTDPGQILQHLRDTLGEKKGERGPNDDAAFQYGALLTLERMFAGQGDATMAKAMHDAGDRLLAERAGEINKGMVVTEAATLYAAENIGSVSNLRSLYMDEVVAHKGLATSFNNILTKYGDKGFPDAVAFLLRAAGDDLATMTSNNDRLQQKEVLDNLYQLEVLNTVRERTDRALQTVGRTFPLAPEASSQAVMRETFGMLETASKMNEYNVTKMSRDMVPDSIEGRIAFLREYRTLASIIPIKVFDEADKSGGGGLRLRERLNDTILQAQDVADGEEQQKLAQQ
jgi:hypothetical protein